jgi:hypothetical protein
MNNPCGLLTSLLPLCAMVCAVVFCTLTMRGCSSNPVAGGNGRIPRSPDHSLRGAKVLVGVAMLSLDLTYQKRVCEDEMRAQHQTAAPPSV